MDMYHGHGSPPPVLTVPLPHSLGLASCLPIATILSPTATLMSPDSDQSSVLPVLHFHLMSLATCLVTCGCACHALSCLRFSTCSQLVIYIKKSYNYAQACEKVYACNVLCIYGLLAEWTAMPDGVEVEDFIDIIHLSYWL